MFKAATKRIAYNLQHNNWHLFAVHVAVAHQQLQDNPVFHKLQTKHFYQIWGAKYHFETHVCWVDASKSFIHPLYRISLGAPLRFREFSTARWQHPSPANAVKVEHEVPRPLDKPKPLPRAPRPRATGQPGTVLEEWRRRSHGSSFAKKKRALETQRFLDESFSPSWIIRDSKTRDSKHPKQHWD